jgi:hypothetical protein
MRSRVRFPALPCGFFLEREDFHDDHGLGSLVELRFKAPPGTSYSYITTHFIGQRNCTSWASHPQKSFTLQPQPGSETTKSIRDMWWHLEKEKKLPSNLPISISWYFRMKMVYTLFILMNSVMPQSVRLPWFDNSKRITTKFQTARIFIMQFSHLSLFLFSVHPLSSLFHCYVCTVPVCPYNGNLSSGPRKTRNKPMALCTDITELSDGRQGVPWTKYNF